MSAPRNLSWHAIVRHAALATFPTREMATAWLEAPAAALGGIPPLAAASGRVGTQRVLAEIDRLRPQPETWRFSAGRTAP